MRAVISKLFFTILFFPAWGIVRLRLRKSVVQPKNENERKQKRLLRRVKSGYRVARWGSKSFFPDLAVERLVLGLLWCMDGPWEQWPFPAVPLSFDAHHNLLVALLQRPQQLKPENAAAAYYAIGAHLSDLPFARRRAIDNFEVALTYVRQCDDPSFLGRYIHQGLSRLYEATADTRKALEAAEKAAQHGTQSPDDLFFNRAIAFRVARLTWWFDETAVFETIEGLFVAAAALPLEGQAKPPLTGGSGYFYRLWLIHSGRAQEAFESALEVFDQERNSSRRGYNFLTQARARLMLDQPYEAIRAAKAAVRELWNAALKWQAYLLLARAYLKSGDLNTAFRKVGSAERVLSDFKIDDRRIKGKVALVRTECLIAMMARGGDDAEGYRSDAEANLRTARRHFEACNFVPSRDQVEAAAAALAA